MVYPTVALEVFLTYDGSRSISLLSSVGLRDDSRVSAALGGFCIPRSTQYYVSRRKVISILFLAQWLLEFAESKSPHAAMRGQDRQSK